MSGTLIAVESQDGGGKGTMVPRIVEHLRGRLGEHAVVQTKEPGGTPLGDQLRNLLFNGVGMATMAPGVLDLLFLASHLQNCRDVVWPALADGRTVVTDRWWTSQFAYATQRFVPPSIATAYHECRGPDPDLLIFLHGDSHTLLSRANSRTLEDHQAGKPWNDCSTQDRVRQAYFDLFSVKPCWRPVCVDGKDIEQVWAEVRDLVDLEVE